MAIILPGAKLDNRAVGTVLADGQEVGRTMQCCHCGCHWVWVHGSGKTRSWCLSCQGFTCGSERCTRPLPHISWKERLELNEKDRVKYPLNFK